MQSTTNTPTTEPQGTHTVEVTDRIVEHFEKLSPEIKAEIRLFGALCHAGDNVPGKDLQDLSGRLHDAVQGPLSEAVTGNEWLRGFVEALDASGHC